MPEDSLYSQVDLRLEELGGFTLGRTASILVPRSSVLSLG